MIVNIHYLPQIQMGIALSSGKASMTQQLLNCPEIGTRLQHMGGKGVP